MLKRAPLFIFFILLIIVLNAFLNPYPAKNVPEGFKPSYGVSYSFEQATWYGLDWRKSYVDLLNNFKFSWVRLPFFWDHPSTSLRASPSVSLGQSSSNFG